jgi:acyl carrier protein
MTEVDDRVRVVLADVFELDPDDIGPETSPDTVEDWDSLQHLTLVLALEEEFGIYFGEEETLDLVTFPLIVEIVRDRLRPAAAE